MTWLFILLDVLILLSVIALGIVIVVLWNKKSSLHRSSLADFRNDEIYEKSKRDKKKLAHIDEEIEQEEIVEILDDSVNEPIDDGDISFSNGYGFTELGVDDEY